jgi:hypothetical protein
VLAAELEQQPGVDRPERRPPFAGALLEPVDVAQQPLDLGRREVRVEHEARPLADALLLAGRAQLVAAPRRAPVLPDDRRMERLAGRRIPADDGLALAGDADRLELPGPHARVVERLAGHRVRDVPDLRRIVLDPAGPREVLRELAVGAADQLALQVEHEAGRARGPLVDGEQHEPQASSRH